VLTRHADQPQRVGVIGLGSGTLASYGRAGDVYHIYEINPLVLDIANTEFSFLKDSKAKLEFSLGDARLSLEREPSQNFDVLLVDAFSGDSVPVHLLTREAFGLYFRHLKPDGILAVHISNKYLTLQPVVESSAQANGKVSLEFDHDPGEDDEVCFGSTWILVMNPQIFENVKARTHDGAQLLPTTGFRGWSDVYSSMFGILKK
jgi:spermidine synthase